MRPWYSQWRYYGTTTTTTSTSYVLRLVAIAAAALTGPYSTLRQ